MPKAKAQVAETSDAEALQADLLEHGLTHLAVRKRGAVLTIESGPPHDPFPCARLRRMSVHLWQLEMPTHSGRWESTPYRAPRNEIVKLLLTDFSWTLADVSSEPENSGGTSDPNY